MSVERARIRVLTVTVSDTRSPGTDVSGARLRELLSEAGFALLPHRIVPDEPELIRAVLDEAEAGDLAEVIVTTGGTGIAPRDSTYEAVAPELEKTLDGFGETFRRLSYDRIGPKAMLSRAIAGTRGRRLVVALPGSPGAVELGVTELLIPVLEHAVKLLRGGGHHAGSSVEGGHGR